MSAPGIPDAGEKARADTAVQSILSPNGGGKSVDPTANVLSLVEAAVTRLDDLRNADSRRLTEIADLRADYEEKLSAAESRRIDAIRAVDVSAVAIAAERASAQASVLANEVTKSAETLRTLVSATDAKVASQITQLQDQLTARISLVVQQMTDRIALLEKSQYQIAGKDTSQDPIRMALAEDVKALTERRAAGGGMEKLYGWIIAAVVAIFAALQYFQ